MSRNIPYGYDDDGEPSNQWIDQYHEDDEDEERE